VYRLQDDAELFADADHHPVMDRLTPWRDSDRGVYLRLHISPGTNELIPHDHKYSFTSYILSGAYTHVWRKRAEGFYSGEFTSANAPLGIVTHERVGSCYTIGYSLVHQTLMKANTVTLFLRGPKEQSRSYAALDMLDRQSQENEGVPSDPLVKSHTDGARPLQTIEYLAIRVKLISANLLVASDLEPVERKPEALQGDSDDD
jgi:hypothetical protein